jgi:PAS domain S-box-containing protein
MDGEMQRLLTVAEELADLGSWAQDLRTGEYMWSEGAYRILGLEPGGVPRDRDLLLEVVHPDDRDRIETFLTTVATAPETLEGERPATEFRIVRPDGAVREVRARSRVERDDAGHPARWVGVAQDVTDMRMSERELQAHYAVSQALRDWATFDEGVMDLLRRLGTALDYPIACLWLWEEDLERLVCRAFWSAPNIDPEPFESAKRDKTYRPGQGTIGAAWAQRRPVVVPDIEQSDLDDTHREASMLGLRSAFAFPALGPDGPVAVLSFHGFEPRAPSASLVQTLTAIGEELGHFLHRRRADLGPRPLSDREIEIVRLAAEGSSGPEIAGQLFISPATVKTHFENIYEKLGVSDRPAAVAHALRIGLIS